MTEDNQLANKKKKGISDVLSDTYASLSEGITGIAASDSKDKYLSVGHVLQAVRRGRFFAQIFDEWKQYREKGKINDDNDFTGPKGDCLQELLDFLDKDCPDEIRFQVMKKIFFVAAAKETSDHESVLPYQYLQICRKMSSGEIMVMLAAYNLLIKKKQTLFNDPHYDHNWLVSIAHETGLGDKELVDYYVVMLVEKNILHPKNLTDSITKDSNECFKIREHNRLTGFGHNLCVYISDYDKTFSE